MSRGTFVANVQRRSWDLSEYEAKAEEKRRIEQEAERDGNKRNQQRGRQQIVVRAPLQHRTKAVELESRLGKHTLITNSTPLNQQGGFYCDVCECLLKDSSTYLDHINGKKHQRALGMTLRAERSTLGDVRAKLEEHKRTAADEAESHAAELERRVQRFTEQVARENEDKKAEKQQAKQQRKEAEARIRQVEDQFDLGRITSESRKRKQKPASDDHGEVDADCDNEIEVGREDDQDERDSKKPKTDAAATATASSSSSASVNNSASSTAAAVTEEEDEDPEAAMMRAMGFATGFAKGKNK